MRVSREEKQRSHKRIVDSAARLFRARGTEGASVADVMREAGLTHGGFYRHFETKDDLVGAAITQAFDSFNEPLAAAIEAGDAAAAVRDFEALYLSAGHVAHPEKGCPAATIGQDIARQPGTAREAFTTGIERVIGLMAQGVDGDDEDARRAAALRRFATLVGAVVIARAGTPALADQVRAACATPAE